MLKELRMTIPTYDPDGKKEWDWSRPETLILREDGGLQVKMGEGVCAPDIVIERAVDRWRLFVNHDGGDGLCIIEFTDTTATIQTVYTGDPPLLTKERVVE